MLQAAYSNVIVVHTPLHASWLNQVEIYFSIVQRKVLTPNDFADLAEAQERLRLYEELTNQQPQPFQWKFDRAALVQLLEQLTAKEAAKNQAHKVLSLPQVPTHACGQETSALAA